MEPNNTGKTKGVSVKGKVGHAATPLRISKRLSNKSQSGVFKENAHTTVKDWGQFVPGEDSAIFASRVALFLNEYEECGRMLGVWQQKTEELKLKVKGVGVKKRKEVKKEMNKVNKEIIQITKRRRLILENSGIFKEQLTNASRFKEMLGKKQREEKVEEEEEEEEEEESLEPEENLDPVEEMKEDSVSQSPMIALQSQTSEVQEYQVEVPIQIVEPSLPDSGIPAQQAEPQELGEDMENQSQGGMDSPGGMLLEEITKLESSLDFRSFTFGDDFPEEGKNKEVTGESGRLVFGPIPGVFRVTLGDRGKKEVGEAGSDSEVQEEEEMEASWGSRCGSIENIPEAGINPNHPAEGTNMVKSKMAGPEVNVGVNGCGGGANEGEEGSGRTKDRIRDGVEVGMHEGVNEVKEGRDLKRKIDANLGHSLGGGESTAQKRAEGAGPPPSLVTLGPPPATPGPPTSSGGRSYARVVAGGEENSGQPPITGSEENQRRFLEALRNGEESVTVEGREIPLSFWMERHGLSAFREQRTGGGARPPPTAGQGVPRRNVARLRWVGGDVSPPRARVVELLFEMGFRVTDIFALIHPSGSPIYDISFVRAEGLELFWSRHEVKKYTSEWRDFEAQAISRQNHIKKVTVLTSNESLSCLDIQTWLSRYGEVTQFPTKIRDEHGIWSGAWTFMVKLKLSGNTVTHIPSSAFLGRDRILVFYQGQPKLCHRCGDPTHFSAQCKAQVCSMCGEIGHQAASCGRIRCNLCGDFGHPFRRCPRSSANLMSSRQEEGRVRPEDVGEKDGEGDSGNGGGAEGPMIRKMKTAQQLRRMENRRKEREGTLRTHAGGSQTFNPEVVPCAEQSEALRESDVEEEIRRREREEETALPTASYHSESGESVREKRPTQRGAKKGMERERAGASTSLEWDHSIPLTLSSQVPCEGRQGKTPPLTETSNKYQALRDLSPSSGGEEEEDEVPKRVREPPESGVRGGVGSPTKFKGKDTGQSRGGKEGEGGGKKAGDGGGKKTGGGGGDKKVEKGVADMDISVSLKRLKGVSDEDIDGGIGKKKAV